MATIAEAPYLQSIRKWAPLIGISRNTLYRWVSEGRYGLRARYVGAHMRLSRDDILKLLDALPKVGG
jgi:excisionase family DNA binding protein